jgi:2,3-bisphosphoglycerate-dependent phosphoglycerate mutase
MSNNELIFIRHAKTRIDKDIPIENWILSEEGSNQAEDFVNREEFYDVDLLISSSEEKAYLTLKPLANKINKKIIKIEELGEIKRPNSEKLTSEQYEDMKLKIFQDLDFSNYDWETANHALLRFRKAIEGINNKYQDKRIIICSHGTVMTLYFAYLKGELDNLMSRWKNLEFGAVGIVRDNKLIKDII